MSKTPLQSPATILVSIIAVGYLLLIGKDLILPLVIAILLFYVLLMFTNWVHSLKIAGRNMPWPLCIVLSVGSVVGLIVTLFSLAAGSVYTVVQQAPYYQEKLNHELIKISHMLESHELDASMLFDYISITPLLSSLGATVTSFAQYAALIAIYTMFIGLEYPSFNKKLKALYPEEKKHKNAHKIITDITKDVGTYLQIKTLMSIITGLSSFIILAAAGVSHAPFWGVVIFALNYIPTVGSILAILMILPVIGVQLGVDSISIFVAILLVSVQLTIGNFIEPRLMGKSLNLSPLVILLALAFWGSIWGPIGALLCVPLMVIINITLSKFEQTRPIAIVLSQKGQIKDI